MCRICLPPVAAAGETARATTRTPCHLPGSTRRAQSSMAGELQCCTWGRGKAHLRGPYGARRVRHGKNAFLQGTFLGAAERRGVLDARLGCCHRGKTHLRNKSGPTRCGLPLQPAFITVQCGMERMLCPLLFLETPRRMCCWLHSLAASRAIKAGSTAFRPTWLFAMSCCCSMCFPAG